MLELAVPEKVALPNLHMQFKDNYNAGEDFMKRMHSQIYIYIYCNGPLYMMNDDMKQEMLKTRMRYM